MWEGNPIKYVGGGGGGYLSAHADWGFSSLAILAQRVPHGDGFAHVVRHVLPLLTFGLVLVRTEHDAAESSRLTAAIAAMVDD